MFEDVVLGLMGLDDDALTDRVGTLELERRRVEAELAAAIAMADARGVYARDGHRSMKGYLRATCNWSNHETRRWRSVATAVNAHPSIGEAWARGRVGGPQVAVLAATHANRRVREALPCVLASLLANAEEMCFDDFAATVEHFVALADADGAHDQRDDAIEHRSAAVNKVGQALDVRVFGGDGVTTDEAIGIFEAFCEDEFRRDLDARRAEHADDAAGQPLVRTAGQRAHDAIIAIFRAAAEARSAARPGSVAGTVVNVVIDARTFARILAAGGLAPTSVDGSSVDPFTGLAASNSLLEDLMIDPARLGDVRCETERGVPVHPHDVLGAVLAGHVRRVVLDAGGHVVDFGRKTRLFEGAARQAAKLLVRRCQHPGCDLPAGWSDVDHNIEWGDGGPTDQSNAGVLCSSHNIAKHRSKLRRRRADNGVDYTVRSDGTIILPVGARTPQFDSDDDPHDDPDEIRRLQHLARQRLRAWCSEPAA